MLFVCIHNSARSQMAEAFLNRVAPDRFQAMSAGFDPGALNPLAVAVMAEVGLDISANRTKSIQELKAAGHTFDHIITVCDESHGQHCPIEPLQGRPLVLTFEDPSAFQGQWEDRLDRTREVRDRIRNFIELWVAEQA